MQTKKQALEALIEALNLFDNYPELYEMAGTYEVIVSAIKVLKKEVQKWFYLSGTSELKGSHLIVILRSRT